MGVLLSVVDAGAATQQWTFESTNAFMRIVPDSKGGCAIIVGQITGPPYPGKLLWFDRAGVIKYQTGISNIQYGTAIECTEKRLVFIDQRPDPEVNLVDETGTVTKIPSAAGTVNAASGGTIPFVFLRNAVVDDKKGFFLVISTTNGVTNTLVRYNNK